MIDLHSHILPGIDDGSRSSEETFEIIRKAINAGFTDVFLTPHYIADQINNNKTKVDIIIKKLKSDLKLKGMNINMYNGCEAYVCQNLNLLVEKNIVSTLNNSRYILIELPMSSKILYLDNLIYKLTTIGLTPIIAHPERYLYVQKDPNMLIELIEKGVLMQSNYGSLIGQYGKTSQKIVEKLVKNNIIHFLGTDTHREGYIYENMPRIMKVLNKLVDAETINLLTKENQEKVINNKEIEIAKPIKVRKFF